jgi:lysophospholipase L1-like esterase
MRPALREAAAGALIHGPRDWNHFNAVGYRVLGEALARTVDESASTECVDWQ